MKSKIQAYIVFGMALLVGLLAFMQFGVGEALGAAALMAYGVTQIFHPVLTHRLGITIATNLKRAKILDAALYAFAQALAPLKAFSTGYNDVPLEGTNKIVVPYYPIETAASKDFNGTYVFDSAELSSKEITVDQRKYQSLSYTSDEARRQPAMKPEEFGLMKGQKLAVDIIADVLSLVTLENFGAAAFTGAHSTFDSDDVADLKGVADAARWPVVGRSIVLDTTYDTNVMKDSDVKTSPSMAITEDALLRGVIPTLSGFGYFATPAIPANGEYLKGFISYRSALLVGFSPIRPTDAVMAQLARYETAVDENGLTLEYREWGNPGTDSTQSVIECNYGKEVGEEAALERIVSQ